jgi:hypothetical protein
MVILVCLNVNAGYSQDANIYPCRTACNVGARLANNKSADSITKVELLKAGRLEAKVGTFTILSYRITMDGPGVCCEICEVNNPGDKFTEQAIKIFKLLRPGSFISFDCITAKDASGHIVGLKPAVYKIR